MTALLTMDEAATELRISVKVLRGHVKDGAIRYVVTGRGPKRPRISFDPADIEQFKEARKRWSAPCPSIVRKGTRSTTSTSSSEVIGFLARREQAIAARRNKPKD